MCQASRCEQKNVDAKPYLIGLLRGLFSMSRAILSVALYVAIVNIQDIRNMHS